MVAAPSTGNKGATLQLQAWIDGFLSGSGEEIDFIAPKATEVAYYVWIDNYCRQNPLDLVEGRYRITEERIGCPRAPLATRVPEAIRLKSEP
jgi:hypothetical protein